MTLAPPRPASREVRGGRLRQAGAGLVTDRRARPADTAVSAAVLAAVAALAFGGHVARGGFYYDDWANSAHTHLAGGYGGALRVFWGITGYRPVLAWYVPTLHELLGRSTALHLAWATTLGVAMSVALYAVLCELRVGRFHALGIAALVLVFPFSDATRLWATSATAHLTAALWLVGLLLALRALDADRSRTSALVLHGASLACYLTSLLLYELPATLMVAGGALYLLAAPWRRAARRWAVDLAVIVPSLGYVLATTQIDTATGRVGVVEHARIILDQGWTIMASAAWPFSSAHRLRVTLVVLVVVVAGAAVAFGRRSAPDARAAARRWLAVAGGGLVATGTAWAVFIPSHPYYSPGTNGVGNRVNVLAAMGIVVLLYAVAALAGVVVLALARRPVRMAPVVAGLATVAVIGAGYLRMVDHDRVLWDRAARAQARTLAALRTSLPHPVHGATIWTFDQPAWEGPGIPVFASTWDLLGAVQLLYDDPTLRGYPALPLTTYDCGPTGMAPHSGYPGGVFAPYGKLYFVDVATGAVDRLDDADECRSATARFRPGPYELPES